jgi:hypothetical protein
VRVGLEIGVGQIGNLAGAAVEQDPACKLSPEEEVSVVRYVVEQAGLGACFESA